MSESSADSVAVNPSGIKINLGSSARKVSADGQPIFNTCPRSLSRKPYDWALVEISVFDNFISAIKLFANHLLLFGICVLVSKNLRGKLVWSA